MIKRIGFFIWLGLFLLIVNFIVKKNKLTKDNLYALLLIVFLLGTFPEAMFSYSIVLANMALIFGFRKIYSLRSGLDTKLKLFDAKSSPLKICLFLLWALWRLCWFILRTAFILKMPLFFTISLIMKLTWILVPMLH